MTLLAYLLAFYLFDGLELVPDRTRTFHAPFGRRWRSSEARLRIDAWPVARAFTAGRLPFDVTSEGVYFVPPRPAWHVGARATGPRFEPFAELGSVRAARETVVANGRPLGRCASHGLAAEAAALLERMRTAAPGARMGLLGGFLAASLDRRAAAAAVAVARRRTERLRALGVANFMLLFAVLPAAIFAGAPDRVVVVLVGLAVVYHLAGLWLYVRARRALGEPSRLGVMALYPPAAMHAATTLSKGRAARFHPLAVGRALLPDARFGELAARELELAGHPHWTHPHLAGSGAPEDRIESLAVYRDELRRFVRRSGVPLERVERARPRTDPSAEAYCPLCLAEYATRPDECHSCRVPVRAYAPTAVSPSSGRRSTPGAARSRSALGPSSRDL